MPEYTDYRITHNGGRWFEMPFAVTLDGAGFTSNKWVGTSMFLWAAKWAVRRDKARRARGSRTWTIAA